MCQALFSALCFDFFLRTLLAGTISVPVLEEETESQRSYSQKMEKPGIEPRQLNARGHDLKDQTIWPLPGILVMTMCVLLQKDFVVK